MPTTVLYPRTYRNNITYTLISKNTKEKKEKKKEGRNYSTVAIFYKVLLERTSIVEAKGAPPPTNALNLAYAKPIAAQ